MLTELQGQIERITYTNEENGFTIARVKAGGYPDLVTITGNLMSPNPGEVLKMKGEWINHPRFGHQFRVVHYQSIAPASVYGIEKYLGSGLIRGIGPVMAKRIVNKFGKETLEVIERDINRLAEVEGIGLKRVGMIKLAWDEQKEIRQVMLFLQSHGVSSGFATKIFKTYGDRSIQLVKQNPYRLATDIFGIGFVSADRIAQKLGFARDCDLRAEAGLLYILQELSGEGHVYYPYELLIDKCLEILEIEREIIIRAISRLALEKRVIIEDLNRDLPDFRVNNQAVYLTRFHVAETGIDQKIRELKKYPKSIRRIDPDRAIEWVQDRLSIKLAGQQVETIRCAVKNKMMIITGGPGTGKTTVINAILKIFFRLKVNILLAAPTGRAAKRMSEATGHEAKTIHRLLEYSIQQGGFQRNEDKPLEGDILILDETSMIDTILMHNLLKAVPLPATVILVGDVNQLPSVGAGNVLRDIIDSGTVPVVTLTEIFRQAEESLIIVNAHRINNGMMPFLESPGPDGDFYFIEQEDPYEVLKIILQLAGERIPGRFKLEPLDDIQVLTPMHKGVVGAGNLNLELQKILNPGQEGLVRGNRSLRVRDKVMQIRNNYDKEVYNGDIGHITRIDPESQVLVVNFDGREIPYAFSELDEIIPAYAVTIHKSQGSEYPAVIIPVLTQHYILLQRNLLYTAVTRGKKLVVLVGTKKALQIAVNNDRTDKRYTYLRHRLAG